MTWIAAGAVGTALGFVVAASLPALAEPSAAFTECAFVSAGWLPGHAPEGAPTPKRYQSITAVPEGWTVVGGTMTSAPAMFVCR